MAVFFSVLKIIGIVAAIVLLIVIALLALILFVPLRYEAKGDIDAKRYIFRVCWLFRIVQFVLQNKDEGGGIDTCICIFGHRTHFLDPERRAKKRKKASHRKKQKKAGIRAGRAAPDSGSEPEGKSVQTARTVSDEGQNLKRDEPDPEEPLQDSKETEPDSKGTVPDTEPAASVTSAPGGPFKKCGDLSETFQTITGKIKKWKHIFETFHPISMILPKLRRFLVRIRPRRLCGDLIFGFEDPSMTGKVIGALSNLYFLYEYEEFHLAGDFEAEQTYITGSFSVKGYLCLIVLLVLVVSLVREKEFRKFVKEVKD